MLWHVCYLFVADVEDLLGKPVQSQLATETGIDMAMEALMDVANCKYLTSE